MTREERRDLIALEAMKILMEDDRFFFNAPDGMTIAQHLAGNCYGIADAMQTERDK
jgi:hypothetical protein